MPGAKQPCPTVAACWSPATPRMRIWPPNRSVVPKSPAQSRIGGSRACGTANNSHSSASQLPSRMFISRVRAAFVASVACTLPPVSRHNRKLSTVPKARRPSCAAARAPSMWSSSQAILVAEKYGSSTRPVRAVIVGSCPACRSAAQASAVRRSCQTMAWWIGRPVARSHTIAVSRWLVMPMPAISFASTPARAIAARTVATTVDQMSSTSCSTKPDAG